MTLKIWDTDPEERERRDNRSTKTYDNEFAFQFRTGMQRDNNPVSLAKWRVTMGDPAVADAIAQLFGGSSQEWDPAKDHNLQVLTDRESVEIVINGPEDVEDKLIKWGRGGPEHECDGETFLSPDEDKGNPCGCPTSLKARKAAARKGRGPSPAITIRFRLADDMELGQGKFLGTAWSLAEVVHTLKNDLAAVGEPALCSMTIERHEFVNEDDELIKYKKPVIKVLGSYNAAIAEER